LYLCADFFINFSKIMLIDKHTVVSLHYKLQEGSAEGELVEETFGADPLVFLYGVGQMIPAFEENLEGKQAGDKMSFGIPADEAYGEYDTEAVAALPLSVFMFEGELAEDMLVVGQTIPLRDEEGNLLYGTVAEVREEDVLVDFNHPMAGVDLYFTVEVESVRAATAEEIDHGHVHGEGGHHH
jgi:FKBP-type peptidyl-prolyl cis-trans isomerase SlyD